MDYAAFATLKPDNFVLVHEPSQMIKRLNAAAGTSITITPQQWVSFLQATAPIVQQVSPSTQVGAGFAADEGQERTYYTSFADVPQLNFLTFDMYKSCLLYTSRCV